MGNLSFILPKTIALNIETLRHSQALTQEEFGTKVGLTARSVRRLEKEGTDSIALINRIADVFSISPLSLLGLICQP